MANDDLKFDLSIDGESYPSQRVSPLFQSDPWPGGHHYFCVLTGKRVGKYFDYLTQGTYSKVSEEDARRFFLSLNLNWRGDENIPIEYFLNSVEELDFDGDSIQFSGVCSPVVGS